MTPHDLALLADAGLSVVLLFFLVTLWRRYTALEDKFVSWLRERASNGDAAAEHALNYPVRYKK